MSIDKTPFLRVRPFAPFIPHPWIPSIIIIIIISAPFFFICSLRLRIDALFVGPQDWVFDQAAATYALDAAMAERLRTANPEAFRNVVKRLLEASSQGPPGD